MATTDSLATFFEMRYFQAACAGKDAYPTAQSVEQVSLMYLSRRIKHHKPKSSERLFQEMDTYQCPFCGRFHVGHSG